MEKSEAIYIRLSENERKQIKEKMEVCNIKNMSAYILKMAIDGMIINLDMPELKEISRLLRYNGNNINQIAKRLNEGKSVYASDIADIKEKQTQITDMVREIYLKLSKI
ncbi:MAG: plasmid mobilization relaxosome protein MobC [Clostridia bacterium]|nr:plasmid mobilization relaxosome protein MobC [Clostridia bacterium]